MFDYVKYVKTVYECSGFTKAADKLCITQPALSIAINKAEEELGVKLFDRKSKPLTLTEAGRLYLEAAEKALALESELKERITATSVKGELRVGAAGIAMNYIVPIILDAFRRKYPEVNTVLYEESAFTLKDFLRNDNLDLFIDTELNESEFISEPLFSNTVFYAVSEELLSPELIDRSYSSQEIVSDKFSDSEKKTDFNCLKDIPYLSLQPRNELYKRAELYFSYYGCHPRTVMYFNQQLTSYRFAQKGYGGAFVGDTLIKARPSDSLRFFSLDFELPQRTVCISYKKNKYLNSAMSAFIETAKELYSQK